MLDIQFIRDNPKLVKEKSRQKGYDVDKIVDELLSADKQQRSINQKVDEIRHERKQLADKHHQANDPELVAKAKELRNQEKELLDQEVDLGAYLRKVPNMPLDEVPVGSSEDENVVVRTVGDKPDFDFKPKSDAELGKEKDYIDKERAAKVAGARFAYLKGDLVRLQFAVFQLVVDAVTDEEVIAKIVQDNNLQLSTKPFTLVLPPAMVRTEPYEASARLDAEEVTYKIAQDELWLNASAEHSLCNMYMDEILEEEQLPIRYLGYATSFRREAGSYGKDAEGIFRMHQFDKLEMEVFGTAETGLEEHKLLVAIQEYLVGQLGLPYQLLQKCTADIGLPNAIGVDINTWMPAQGAYRETHTADYMTDYQARRLRTKVRRKNGSLQLAHTNDATAFAFGRILKAILENYQQADGSVEIPEVLQPYMGGRTKLA